MSVDYGVLSNDWDSDGQGTECEPSETDAMKALLVKGPTYGTLVLEESGAFVYTPNVEWAGMDEFTYVANDGAANSSVTTVTLNVTEGKGLLCRSASTSTSTVLSVLAWC
jgi:Bacterial Ig domain